MSNERDGPEQQQRYEEAVAWLFRLQDEDQSTEQIEQWIEWCRADPANQQAFEHLVPLWQVRAAVPANASLPLAPLPVASLKASPIASQAASLQAARDAARAAELANRARRWLPAPRWLAAAAVVVAVAAAALVWPLLRRDSAVQLDAVAGFESKHAEPRLAQLVDGSQIALGAQSQVAINYRESRRDIEIQQGEAFFTVKHDKSRPFVVRAGGLQVVAVGTAFDVNRQGTRVIVSVQQGVVEVSDGRSGASDAANPANPATAAAAGGPRAPLRVARGEQLVFDEGSSDMPSMRTINPDFADAWRRGRFEYVAEPLSAIVEDLNRYSHEHIVLQDSRLGALRYSGTIDVTLIDEWLRALPNIFAMDVQFDNNHQVVLFLPK